MCVCLPPLRGVSIGTARQQPCAAWFCCITQRESTQLPSIVQQLFPQPPALARQPHWSIMRSLSRGDCGALSAQHWGSGLQLCFLARSVPTLSPAAPGCFPAVQQGTWQEPFPCPVPTLLPCSAPGKDRHKPHSPAGSPHDLRSVPDRPGEEAVTVSMLSIPSHVQGQGIGALGPICVCGTSPVLQHLVWGWQHSSRSGCTGGLDQAGSAWRRRHSAFPRAVLPAELLLRSSQNLKPPSPAGSCTRCPLTPGCSCLC